MKKLTGILAVLAMLFVALVPFAVPGNVHAAACANVSSFGAVTVQVPTLHNIKDQVIWIRMQSSDTVGRVFAEVNAEDCLEIGGKLQPDTWQWQTIRSDNEVAGTYSFKQHDNNTMKIIGIYPGVRVDRLLVTDTSCVPQDFGNNCQAVDAQLAARVDEQEYTILPPPAGGPLHGRVQLSSTPAQNQDNLKEVSYSVAGTVVQQSSRGLMFDTGRVQNGKSTVYITTTLQDGTQIREMVVVDIKNPENALTPLVRWAKLNQRALQAAGLIILSILAGIILIWVALSRLRKRRIRIFHGL